MAALKKPSFWQKAAHIGKQVGKIAMATAGMGLTVVGGLALTAVGFAIDVGPVGICLAGALICLLAGAPEAAAACVKAAAECAFLSMMINSPSNKSEFITITALKETGKLLLKEGKFISEQVRIIKNGPDTTAQTREGFNNNKGSKLKPA
jgi:hypothetical protein